MNNVWLKPDSARMYFQEVARAAAVVVALVLFTAAPGRALDMNGFMPPAAHGAVAVSYVSESYDHFWRGETKVNTPGFLDEVSTRSVATWLTWGLTSDIALVVNMTGIDVTTNGTDGLADDGLQDVTALVKYRFASWERGAIRQSLAVAGGARIPIADYTADAPVSLGDGTTDALLRLVYQLERGRFYFSQQAGFDLRGGDAPNGVPLYTEIGYTVGQVTLTGFYTEYHASSGTDIGDAGFTFPSNREEFQRAGVKVYGRISEKLGVTALAFTTFDGRNSGDASGLAAGFNVSF